MRSFMKIAAMIMAVAMLCSFTALGAEIKALTATDANSDDPNVKINCTSDATQTALLVYKGTALSDAEDVVYIDQYSEGATIEPALDLSEIGAAYGTYTVVAGGIDVEKAESTTFDYTKISYAVTLDFDATKGYVTYDYDGDLDDVAKNTTITFNFYPYMGYEITSASVNEDTQTAVKTGTSIAVTVTEQATTVKVDFAEVDTAAAGMIGAFTSAEVYDVPADTKSADEDDWLDGKLVFGKIAAGKEVAERGMYLQKWNEETSEWEDAKTSKNVGPYFVAEGHVDNQYGIRFLAFDAGKYKVNAYAKYTDGTEATGPEVVFEVK